MGLWHEVAKIPNRFQKQCAHGATAEYTLRKDGCITVVNRCVKKDGTEDGVEGDARIVDKATNAKLAVSFVSFLGWRPFWGDYWIIGLDEDYQWVVVGTPNRKFGWVLARTPTLDPGSREKVTRYSSGTATGARRSRRARRLRCVSLAFSMACQ